MAEPTLQSRAARRPVALRLTLFLSMIGMFGVVDAVNLIGERTVFVLEIGLLIVVLSSSSILVLKGDRGERMAALLVFMVIWMLTMAAIGTNMYLDRPRVVARIPGPPGRGGAYVLTLKRNGELRIQNEGSNVGLVIGDYDGGSAIYGHEWSPDGYLVLRPSRDTRFEIDVAAMEIRSRGPAATRPVSARD